MVDKNLQLARFSKTFTKLPCTIWVAEKGYSAMSMPILYASSTANLNSAAAFTISKLPELKSGSFSSNHEKAVKEYIIDNMVTLVKYWSGEIDTSKLYLELR